MNVIDSAPWYGQGKSETILGVALKGAFVCADGCHMAIAVGPFHLHGQIKHADLRCCQCMSFLRAHAFDPPSNQDACTHARTFIRMCSLARMLTQLKSFPARADTSPYELFHLHANTIFPARSHLLPHSPSYSLHADVPRSAYYMNTKVGRYLPEIDAMFDFSSERVTQSVDESLRRLQLGTNANALRVPVSGSGPESE